VNNIKKVTGKQEEIGNRNIDINWTEMFNEMKVTGLLWQR
jgi:hypothetical protein